MRKLLISAGIILTFIFAVSAQKVEPKNVTDFYYLLPEEHFAPFDSGDGKTPGLKDYRKSLIKIEDLKNGYLKLEGDWEGWAEVAIFKKKDGKYIVGIVSVGCGPVCDSDLTFLRFENGKWSDITAEVLPEIGEAQLKAAYQRHQITEDDEPGLVYELPRAGRIIKVSTDGDKSYLIFELAWNGEKFVLSEK